jgi:hypothetical protein
MKDSFNTAKEAANVQESLNANKKQKLFEMMSKIDPTYKSNINEELKRWFYNWGDGWSAVIVNPFGTHFTWTVREINDAIPPFQSSDWAQFNTFEEAEDDMFSEIMNRIGHTPKSQKNKNI